MTCACSRQRFKAEKSGRFDVTLHCKPNGNFERLQCDMGVCWCAEEMYGEIEKNTFAVPQNLWTYLPCCKFTNVYFYLIIRIFSFIYIFFKDNASEHGDKYLRKCESAAHAQNIIQKKLINRGAIKAISNQIRCNYDGTHSPIIVENAL